MYRDESVDHWFCIYDQPNQFSRLVCLQCGLPRPPNYKLTNKKYTPRTN